MKTIEESILSCRINTHDDDSFIDELNKLVEKSGEKVYHVIIKTLTHLDVATPKAKKYWSEITDHREKLSNVLDRRISLVTAMSDYFNSSEESFKNLKIVEINAFDKIIKDSTHDNLTGLYNKAYLHNALNQHLSLARRHKTDLSVLFIDIDDFKGINDTLGHSSGDIVIKIVADIIRDELRESDVIARFGGDEFVILMPNTYKMNALLLSERIREAVHEKVIELKNTSCQVTISGGLASFPTDASKTEDLLNLADSALYRAKGAGKNSISLFKEDQRRFLRIKFNREIKIKQLGFNPTPTLLGTSKDIAIGGILFENKEPIEIGTKLQVSMPMDKGEDPILLIGTIVRVEVFEPDKYDIGMILSFKEMETIAKDEISKFLVHQSKKLPQ